MTPDEYCQQKAAQSGSSFYYSFLFLPPERRRAITALYAFCREVDDVVDEVTDPGVARSKLAWWRAEIVAAYAGTPQHPVAPALQPVVARYGLPQAHLQAIDRRHGDGPRAACATSTSPSSKRIATASPGVVGLLSAEIFGYSRAAHARLRARPRHRLPAHQHHPRRRRGRPSRPHLPAAGRPRAVRRPAVDAAARPRAVSVPRADGEQVDRARTWYERALAALPAVDRAAQRPGSSWRRSTGRCSTRSSATATRCCDQRVSLTPLRKLWIAWKTSRGERARGPGAGGRRAAVIGAGWAGCTAAVTLARQGPP